MPASFSPAPNSMASLSIEEGAASRQSTSTLDTATTTVPVVMPAEKVVIAMPRMYIFQILRNP